MLYFLKQTSLASRKLKIIASTHFSDESQIISFLLRIDNFSIIRGVDADQNIDPYILPVVKEKIAKLPEGDRYFVRCEHMKRLNAIYHKNINEQKLTKEDLLFLYEIKENIQGFGFSKDPRVQAILDTRKIKEDLAEILNWATYKNCPRIVSFPKK